MVGPRSSGCRTCVRRKIKCDETRPFCNRCTQGGFECLGYKRPLQWLPPATTTPATTSSPPKSSPLPSRSKAALDEYDTLSSESFPSTPPSSTHSTARKELVLAMPGLDYSLSMPKSPSAYDDNAYCLLFINRFFAFGTHKEDLDPNKFWIWRAMQEPSKNPVANLACRSLTLAFAANVHRSASLRSGAMEAQQAALAATHQALKIGNETFDVLCATYLLRMYETCIRTIQQAWRQHIRAFQHLAEMKGPQYFSQQPAKALLALARHSITMDAIVNKRRCFLERREWYELYSPENNINGLDVELGNDIVRGLFIQDRMKELKISRDPKVASQMFQDYLALLVDMRMWWVLWSSDPKLMPTRMIARYDPDGMHPPPPMPGNEVSTVLQFCHLHAAAVFTRYHSHIIIVLSWINQLLSLEIPGTVTSSPDFELLAPSPQGRNPRVPKAAIAAHALSIVEALHYFTMPAHNSIGAVSISLPARTLIRVLPREGPHAAWLSELLKYVSGPSGFEVPQFFIREPASGMTI